MWVRKFEKYQQLYRISDLKDKLLKWLIITMPTASGFSFIYLFAYLFIVLSRYDFRLHQSVKVTCVHADSCGSELADFSRGYVLGLRTQIPRGPV